ncbi:MAG: hypothetical protein LBS62_05135 [Clostridiales bacterium]|jgi:vacuolar-type H+-ATPase subunit E/Vma4|nr:hypothetical protein [Clostridiales bacterium]
MKLDAKLANFSKIVAQEAHEKREQLIAEMKRESERIRGDTERRARERAEAAVRKEAYNAEERRSRKVLEASVAAKKSMIELRNSFIEKLFINIEERIKSYVSTKEYEEQLAAEIKKHAGGAVSAERGCVVFLAPGDMRLAPGLSECGAEIKVAKENFLGGFKIYWPGKNAIEDYSFKTRLEDERKNFSMFKI